MLWSQHDYLKMQIISPGTPLPDGTISGWVLFQDTLTSLVGTADDPLRGLVRPISFFIG